MGLSNLRAAVHYLEKALHDDELSEDGSTQLDDVIVELQGIYEDSVNGIRDRIREEVLDEADEEVDERLEEEI